MAASGSLPLQEERAKVTRGACRLGNDVFEASAVTGFASAAHSFGPSLIVKAGLLFLAVLMLASAVLGIMTNYWIAAVTGTVLAIPLFFLASVKSTRVLTVELSDGKRIEYVGTSDHIERVEAAIGMATIAEDAGAPA